MAELYDFQSTSVKQLLDGKHIVVAGCLAGGTKIPLANGEIKNVEDIKSGDKLISYDEDKSMFVENEVDIMFRTCHKPKPMIKLEYEGETITTTYDHPFFNGEGYYPLYQLIWGALEASQRVQLKLLCEQYGQAFNDKAIRCKHCSSNETVSGRKWVLQNDDGWEDCKSTQNSSGELARKSQRIGLCEPFELRQNRQQSGQSRVVLSEVQRLVWNKAWQNKNPQESKANERLDDARQPEHTKFLSRQYAGKNEYGEEKTLRCFSKEIPASGERQAEGGCDWKATVLEAEPYYTISMRTAPYTYCIGQQHYFVTHNCGAGKTAMALVWAEQKCMTTGKDKVVVVTTASKSRTGDFEQEAGEWCPSLLNSLSSFSVLSWHKLRAWVESNWNSLGEYVYVFDEIQRAKAGVSSGMGKAFLRITKQTEDWAGFTGTPGDTWLSFYPYMQACNLVRNKTGFMSMYATVQTYKGFPEIVGWRHEDELQKMWASISYAPDTDKVMSELPEQTHKVFTFKKPSKYDKTFKTRYTEDGTFLDTPGALCAELRRQCFTKDKQEWVKDFVEGLESGCVFFYNFIKTGDMLEETMRKVMPKDAKIWRIDGSHHDIPKADTIGPKDMVLCQWQSGSEALNLQFLHYWVAVELCYSYSTANQARGRIRRLGQKHPQWYGYLLTEDTIEQDILKCLKQKGEFSEANWCISKNITTKGE